MKRGGSRVPGQKATFREGQEFSGISDVTLELKRLNLPQPRNTAKDYAAVRAYFTAHLPAGYGHIYDFVTAIKVGEIPPLETQAAIANALEALLRASTERFGELDQKPDWQKLNYLAQFTNYGSKSLKVDRRAALAAFAESLGINQSAGAKGDPYQNLDLAVAVARKTLAGKSVAGAIDAVASSKQKNPEVDRLDTVQRAWRRHRMLALTIASSQLKFAKQKERLTSGSVSVGQIIGETAQYLSRSRLTKRKVAADEFKSKN